MTNIRAQFEEITSARLGKIAGVIQSRKSERAAEEAIQAAEELAKKQRREEALAALRSNPDDA